MSKKTEEKWILNKGGRSVDTGPPGVGTRIRAENSPGIDIPAIMARIARLPDLERIYAKAGLLRDLTRGNAEDHNVDAAELELFEAIETMRGGGAP